MWFAGKYALHSDDKGRLRIPQRFRERMGTTAIYAMYSAGGCLSFVTKEEGDKLMEHFREMVTVADTAVLKAARVIMAHMCEITEDSQGRFTLPPELKKMAGIDRDVLFVGMGNKVELWDPKRFDDNIMDNDYDYPYKEKFEAVNGELVF